MEGPGQESGNGHGEKGRRGEFQMSCPTVRERERV